MKHSRSAYLNAAAQPLLRVFGADFVHGPALGLCARAHWLLLMTAAGDVITLSPRAIVLKVVNWEQTVLALIGWLTFARACATHLGEQWLMERLDWVFLFLSIHLKWCPCEEFVWFQMPFSQQLNRLNASLSVECCPLMSEGQRERTLRGIIIL